MRALALSLTLLAVASCGGPDQPGQGPGPDLADLPLRSDEVPAGLRLDSGTSGPIDSLRDVLPPLSAVPQLPPLTKEMHRGFLGGYHAVYQGSPDEGPTSASSSALRFADPEIAARFLEYLREVQAGEITVGSSREDIQLLDTPNLGEEGYGWHRVAPGGETSGCSWRRGDLVLTLTLGGPVGRAPAAAALELSRAVDSRLSPPT
ncbi:MAG: hypothetical protein ACRDHM_05980 [Actinomycetota bacterium]